MPETIVRKVVRQSFAKARVKDNINEEGAVLLLKAEKVATGRRKIHKEKGKGHLEGESYRECPNL